MHCDACCWLAMQIDNYPLTRQETARRLALSLRAVDNLLAGGQLPFFKLGRAVRIDPGDLDLFLADRKVHAKKEVAR